MSSDLDILTLAEAKRAINRGLFGGTTALSDDDLDSLEVMVTGVSRMIDQLCGPVVERTISAERHEAAYTFQLDETPVASVATVTEYVNGVGTVLTGESATVAGGYLYDPRTRSISRRSSFGPYPFLGPVVVTYSAGRFASTSDVTAQFKLAASIILRHNWSTDHGAGAVAFGSDGEAFGYEPGFAIPKRARDALFGEFRISAIA